MDKKKEEEVELRIQVLAKSTISLTLSLTLSSTVSHLLTQIGETLKRDHILAFAYFNEKSKIVYSGKVLNGEDTLTLCEIKDNSLIHLILNTSKDCHPDRPPLKFSYVKEKFRVMLKVCDYDRLPYRIIVNNIFSHVKISLQTQVGDGIFDCYGYFKRDHMRKVFLLFRATSLYSYNVLCTDQCKEEALIRLKSLYLYLSSRYGWYSRIVKPRSFQYLEKLQLGFSRPLNSRSEDFPLKKIIGKSKNIIGFSIERGLKEGGTDAIKNFNAFKCNYFDNVTSLELKNLCSYVTLTVLFEKFQFEKLRKLNIDVDPVFYNVATGRKFIRTHKWKPKFDGLEKIVICRCDFDSFIIATSVCRYVRISQTSGMKWNFIERSLDDIEEIYVDSVSMKELFFQIQECTENLSQLEFLNSFNESLPKLRIQNLIIRRAEVVDWKKMEFQSLKENISTFRNYNFDISKLDLFKNQHELEISEISVSVGDTNKEYIEKCIEEGSEKHRVIEDVNELFVSCENLDDTLFQKKNFSKLKELTLRGFSWSAKMKGISWRPMKLLKKVCFVGGLFSLSNQVFENYPNRIEQLSVKCISSFNWLITGKNWNGFQNLKSLSMVNCPNFSDAFFGDSVVNTLEKLEIVNSRRIFVCVHENKVMEKLEEVKLTGVQIMCDSFFQLHKFNKLKRLTIKGCVNVEGKNWNEMPELRHLSVHNCRNLDDSLFQNNELPSLENLEIVETVKMKGENWIPLKSLTKLSVRSCLYDIKEGLEKSQKKVL